MSDSICNEIVRTAGICQLCIMATEPVRPTIMLNFGRKPSKFNFTIA